MEVSKYNLTRQTRILTILTHLCVDKPLSRDGGIGSAAVELEHLAVESPVKAAVQAIVGPSTSDISPTRMEPFVDVPPYVPSRSRDVSQDVDMQDLRSDVKTAEDADQTLDNIGKSGSAHLTTARMTMPNGKSGETATKKRAHPGSGKANRPFERRSKSPVKEVSPRAAIYASDSSDVSSPKESRSSPVLALATETRSISPPSDITASKSRRKKNRVLARKQAIQGDSSDVGQKQDKGKKAASKPKPKRTKQAEPDSEVTLLASQGLDDAAIAAALAGGRPSRRSSAINAKVYVEPESDSDTEDQEEEEDSITEEVKTEVEAAEKEETDYDQPESTKATARRASKGKGKAKAEETEDSEPVAAKGKQKETKAKTAASVRRTVSESNAAKPKPKKAESGKKRSISNKELAKLARSSAETEDTEAASEGSSVYVNASKSKPTKQATSKKASKVNGRKKAPSSSDGPRASSSAPRKRSLSVSSDSPLPSSLPLPFSSQQTRAAWEFELLENELFITVAARRTERVEDEEEDMAEDADPPYFWWPAKIQSRNRQNFRVKLVLDAKKEILGFS